MSRILAIDYGAKRVGLAITDKLKIIASALTTIENKELVDFLRDYCAKEEVETIVIGLPLRLNNELSDIETDIQKLIKKIAHHLPQIKIERQDERFTSKMAMQAMITGGMKKKQRREKGNLDKISAAIILQDYLESIDC